MNRLVVYSLPIAMSSLTGNNAMDLLYLLKENFKNILFDLLIIGRSLVKKYQVLPPNIFYGLEAYGTQWEVAPLKIR